MSALRDGKMSTADLSPIVPPNPDFGARTIRLGRPLVYHHSCVRDGDGNGPCSPRCNDPWVSEVPGPGSQAFATLAEAFEHAARWAEARRRDQS